MPRAYHLFPLLSNYLWKKPKEMWQQYWRQVDQPWRTEPEITKERQDFLAARRSIKPDLEKGIYPFKGIQLSRADMEWLLATHDDGLGPIDWSDESQRNREGVDIRGADLSQVNLSRLPLACLRGGLDGDEWSTLSDEEDKYAIVLMKEVDLTGAHLEGAFLRGANLEKADIFRANLENVDLNDARLSEAYLSSSHMEKARLSGAHLEQARLSDTCLKGASFHQAHLEEATLRGANLEKSDLSEASLEDADLSWAKLEEANLREAHLQGANLRWADLGKVNFSHTKLANQRGIGPFFADAQWRNTNLALIDWPTITIVGDEYRAKRKYEELFPVRRKSKVKQLEELEIAIRANRQIAVELQVQGLNEEAARFSYHAQLLQQEILWMKLDLGNPIQKMIKMVQGLSLLQRWKRVKKWRFLSQWRWKLERSTVWRFRIKARKWVYKRIREWQSWMNKLGAFFFSFFFGLLAGYGYRPGRTIFWYLTVILVFTIANSLLGHLPFFPDALVFSIMSFHGRGFFPNLNSEV